MDLARLQNLIKRDPRAYKEDFDQQYKHFKSQLEIFKLKPKENSKQFSSLIRFISAVCESFREELKDYPSEIITLLDENADILDSDLRKTLVQSLITFRNRDLLQPTDLLPLFFKLFRVHDKILRDLLYKHIVSDISKTSKTKARGYLNKTLQNFMFKMLEDSSEIAQKMSILVMIDLYNKNVWTSSKSVNIIAQACLGNGKVVVPALKFFIEPVEDYDSDEEEENTSATVKILKTQMRSMHSKKTKGRLNQWDKKIKKAKKGKTIKDKGRALPAIEQIFDPHSFADKLFRKAKTSNHSFDIRLMMLNLVARVIKVHKLILVNFYPFIQKYLDSKQTNINYIFVILIQACHEMIHPDILTPLVQTIVNKFVCEFNPGTIISLGLNSVREICLRCPLSMNSEILRDISQFKSFGKDKGVVMAAKAIVNLFRKVHPKLLHRKDRGREGQDNVHDRVPAPYGHSSLSNRVEGAHLLEKALLLQNKLNNGELDEEDNQEEDVNEEEDDVDEEEDNQDEREEEEIKEEVKEKKSNKHLNDDLNEKEEMEDQDGDQDDFDDEEEGDDENNSNEEHNQDDEEEDSEIYHDSKDEQWNNDKPNLPKKKAKNHEKAVVDVPKKRKREMLEALRFLGDEDYEKIDKLKEMGLENVSMEENDDSEEEGPSLFVSERDIEPYEVRKKRGQEERKEKFKTEYVKNKKKKLGVSLTNEEKKKNTPWILARQSNRVRSKVFLKLNEKVRLKEVGRQKFLKKKRKKKFL